MAELVDAHGSGPCAARCGGSSPLLGTIKQLKNRIKAQSVAGAVFLLPVKLPAYFLVFLIHDQVEFYTIGTVYHGCFFPDAFSLIVFREPLGG